MFAARGGGSTSPVVPVVVLRAHLGLKCGFYADDLLAVVKDFSAAHRS
jgi:hypothetical protein